RTRLYLHLHCVCANRLLSLIGLASFYGEIWWSGNQPYLTMKRGFFYPTLEDLWNSRHSQGFSKTITKKESSSKWLHLHFTKKEDFFYFLIFFYYLYYNFFYYNNLYF